MSEWQPIDTCPKDGSWFLAADSHTPFAYRARWGGDYDAVTSEGQMVSMEQYGCWTGWAAEWWCFMPDPPHMRTAITVPQSPQESETPHE